MEEQARQFLYRLKSVRVSLPKRMKIVGLMLLIKEFLQVWYICLALKIRGK